MVLGNAKSTQSLREVDSAIAEGRSTLCGRSEVRMDVGACGDSVQGLLRANGYTQKNRAHELGLHPKVLSRKLHSSENVYLTRMEVKLIITTLARCHHLEESAILLIGPPSLGIFSFSL